MLKEVMLDTEVSRHNESLMMPLTIRSRFAKMWCKTTTHSLSDKDLAPSLHTVVV
jgi:hypothetical protein